MAIKLNIGDPKTKKTYKKEIEDITPFLNKKLKQKIDGSPFGLKNYELEITGGSDKQGFPMRSDLDTTGRKRPLVVSGTGAKKKGKGIRQRKTVRGNTISEEIVQINLKITKQGTIDLEKALGLVQEEAPKEEAKSEEKKEEVKTEEKKKEVPKEEKPVEEPKKEEPKPEEKKEEKPKEEVKETQAKETPKTEEKKEIPKEEKTKEVKEEPKKE